MYYIGISAYYHESSVFLTDNNGTDCFIKEESFSRIKGDKNFPQRCLKFLIKKFDLKNDNIKSICFYEKPFKSWWEIFKYSIKNPFENRKILSEKQSVSEFSPFLWADGSNKAPIIELPTKCGNAENCEIVGWVVFETPKSITYNELIFDSADTIHMRFPVD